MAASDDQRSTCATALSLCGILVVLVASERSRARAHAVLSGGARVCQSRNGDFSGTLPDRSPVARTWNAQRLAHRGWLRTSGAIPLSVLPNPFVRRNAPRLGCHRALGRLRAAFHRLAI